MHMGLQEETLNKNKIILKDLNIILKYIRLGNENAKKNETQTNGGCTPEGIENINYLMPIKDFNSLELLEH